MKSTNALVKRLKNNGVVFTDNPKHAIWILADGQMIDGLYEYGSRGEDHRIIEAGVSYDRYDTDFWDRLHKEYRLVRVCPEAETVLIRSRQQLTEIQSKIISEIGFTVERY